MKKIIRSNSVLFYFWFHLYRRWKGVRIKFFSRTTKFLLDGYPRSGNTFITHIAKHLLGEDIFIHHFHAIAPIKIALNKNYPCYILIRNPEDAVTSYYLKKFALTKEVLPEIVNQRLLEELLNEYIDYYSFVKEKRDKVNVINFKDIIENPFSVIEDINNRVFNGSMNINNSMCQEVIDTYSGATDTLGSSKPNSTKNKLKKELKTHLENFANISQAKELYHGITNIV